MPDGRCGYSACNIMQQRRFLAQYKKNKTYWSLIACISLLGPTLNYMEPRDVRMNRILKANVVWPTITQAWRTASQGEVTRGA